MKKASNFVEHIELFLGKIKGGWNREPSSDELWPFQIIEMTNGIFKGISAFSTLGLGNYKLKSGVSDKIIFQELLFLFPTSFGYRNIPSVIYSIGEYVLDQKLALLRGDVFDHFRGFIFDGLKFNSFYIAPPACLPYEFASFKFNDKQTVVVTWLIPIYENERLYIKQSGWNLFEQKIEELNIDFFDINRKSIV